MENEVSGNIKDNRTQYHLSFKKKKGDKKSLNKSELLRIGELDVNEIKKVRKLLNDFFSNGKAEAFREVIKKYLETHDKEFIAKEMKIDVPQLNYFIEKEAVKNLFSFMKYLNILLLKKNEK